MPSIAQWFQRTTGSEPFRYRRQFLEEGEIPEPVDVPNGLGKTAMAAGKRKGSSNGSKR